MLGSKFQLNKITTLIILLVLFSLAVFFGPISSKKSNNLPPAAHNEKLSPEENLLLFAKKVLKEEYIPKKLNLKRTLRTKNLAWYRQKVKLDKETVMIFHYDEGINDKKEHTKFIEIIENKDHKNANLDTVLGVFDKYLNMPKVDKSAWVRTDFGKNFIVYQIVMDNPDGTYDGRTSAIVTDEKGKVSIRIDACHVTMENTAYDKHTCVGQ
ncbi:MAG: hypothetical protein A2776_01180 [Candidatus Levybacteria bacterium RIFCSPHIGHO2_01_FULL_40_10]|nr:MAG: hypothetical protein A2776_01180 [Candidatus Levybacteria bacterium RIFCSPHIGHO2_01_FULL_40_10]